MNNDLIFASIIANDVRETSRQLIQQAKKGQK